MPSGVGGNAPKIEPRVNFCHDAPRIQPSVFRFRESHGLFHECRITADQFVHVFLPLFCIPAFGFQPVQEHENQLNCVINLLSSRHLVIWLKRKRNREIAIPNRNMFRAEFNEKLQLLNYTVEFSHTSQTKPIPYFGLNCCRRVNDPL